MPWRDIRPMDSKIQFVSLALENIMTMTDLCSLFNISRKTGYKWLSRYINEGPEGLQNRSTTPKSIPHETSKEIKEFIILCRKKHPSWGARKITQQAGQIAPHLEFPSETTVNNIIERQGLTRKKRKRRKPGHPGRPSATAQRPNDIWTTDFKGEFKTKDGSYCYPLTLLDEYSRFLLDCQGLYSTSHSGAYKVFKRAFQQYGLPRAIKSDNGTPFATIGIGRLSKLSVWWIRLGIDPILIQPGSPYQNGVHERMHKTLKDESTIPPAGNLKSQQRKFNTWREEYNSFRPHESLQGKYPCQIYRPSLKKFPSRVPQIDYPDHFEVRLVSRNKCFSWRQEPVFVSSNLVKQYIGLEEVMDGIWAVYFSWKRLGFFDEKKMQITDNLTLSKGEKSVTHVPL